MKNLILKAVFGIALAFGILSAGGCASIAAYHMNKNDDIAAKRAAAYSQLHNGRPYIEETNSLTHVGLGPSGVEASVDLYSVADWYSGHPVMATAANVVDVGTAVTAYEIYMSNRGKKNHAASVSTPTPVIPTIQSGGNTIVVNNGGAGSVYVSNPTATASGVGGNSTATP